MLKNTKVTKISNAFHKLIMFFLFCFAVLCRSIVEDISVGTPPDYRLPKVEQNWFTQILIIVNQFFKILVWNSFLFRKSIRSHPFLFNISTKHSKFLYKIIKRVLSKINLKFKLGTKVAYEAARRLATCNHLKGQHAWLLLLVENFQVWFTCS